MAPSLRACRLRVGTLSSDPVSARKASFSTVQLPADRSSKYNYSFTRQMQIQSHMPVMSTDSAAHDLLLVVLPKDASLIHRGSPLRQPQRQPKHRDWEFRVKLIMVIISRTLK